MSFHLSISKELLTKPINNAKSIITIIEKDVMRSVFRARKSHLFDFACFWIKKDNLDFDVIMGS